MNITLWTIGYVLIDLLKYTLFFFAVFNVPVYRKKISIPLWLIISLAINIGYYMVKGLDDLLLVIPNLCFFLLIVLIKKKERLKGAFLIVLTWIVMDSVSAFIRLFFFIITGKDHYLLGASAGITLTDRALALIIPVIYHIIVNLILKKKFDYSLFPFQWGILFTCFIGLMFIIPPLVNVMTIHGPDPRSYAIMCLSLFTLLFLFIVVMVIQSHIMKRNNEMKQEEIKYQYMLKAQADFFKGLKKNDEEIRIFRHDLRAHITALRKYINENDGKNMNQYLDDMEEAIAVRSAKKYTNNVVVDAVINDQVKVMNEKEIDFEFNGLPQIRNNISDYDLCTVFYNTIKNAIEGCEKVEADRKSVDIDVENRGEKLLIKVCNDTVLNDMVIEEGLHTTKKDKTEHGFGIKSVRAVVKRYNGIYRNEVKNGKYIVSIAI